MSDVISGADAKLPTSRRAGHSAEPFRWTMICDDFPGLIDAADRIVLFTGAGISTESGIPDFRSPGGIWTKQTPIDFADFMRSDEARRETWRRRFAMEPILRQAAPNRGHRAVAELIRSGKASAVITQNIDGLHQDSGIPDDKVIELHGNTTYAHCLDCGTRYEIEALRVDFESDRIVPHCACGGWVKTATISFGQSMPINEMRRAETGDFAGGFVRCHRLIAGGVSRGGFSGTGETERFGPSHTEPPGDWPG